MRAFRWAGVIGTGRPYIASLLPVGLMSALSVWMPPSSSLRDVANSISPRSAPDISLTLDSTRAPFLLRAQQHLADARQQAPRSFLARPIASDAARDPW